MDSLKARDSIQVVESPSCVEVRNDLILPSLSGLSGSHPELSSSGAGLLEKEFECSVCLEEMRPPAKIFQCRNGHVMCGECAEHPEAVARCPSCRMPLMGETSDCVMMSHALNLSHSRAQATAPRVSCATSPWRSWP